jgi:hypothetical protein
VSPARLHEQFGREWEAAFWVPLELDSGASRGMLLPAIARMRPAATLAAVLEEGRRLLEDTGDARIQHRLLAETLQQQMAGGVRRALWILMAAVTVVFMIATVNIALLLLTWGASREREFSIRVALGAGRNRQSANFSGRESHSRHSGAPWACCWQR